jgi:hypothetical protein
MQLHYEIRSCELVLFERDLVTCQAGRIPLVQSTIGSFILRRRIMITKVALGFLSLTLITASFGFTAVTTAGNAVYSVNPSEFISLSGSEAFLSGFGLTATEAYAAVHLPDGVNLTKMIFYWRDGSTVADCTVTFVINMRAGYAGTYLVAVSTSGSANTSQSSDVDTSIPINSDYPYYLHLSCPGMALGTIMVWGVSLEYSYGSFLSIIRK